MLLFINSNMEVAYPMEITIAPEILAKRQAWVWDADTGERYKLDIPGGKLDLNIGPAEARLLVFDKVKKGNPYKPPVLSGSKVTAMPVRWDATFKHLDGTTKEHSFDELKDLKDTDFMSFAGTVTYRITINVTDKSAARFLNLGKVVGISTVTVNGQQAGTQWYGRRIYDIGNLVKDGSNTIEISVVTTMGNYMKTLTDNPVAQLWTNNLRKNQPIQSMGLIGPVTCYGE